MIKIDKLKLAIEKGITINGNGEVFYKNNKLNPYKNFAKNQYPYYEVSFRYGKKILHIKVHQLQAYIKYGEALLNAECVRHLDGNSLNNNYDNIAIGTQHDNMMDIPKKRRIEHAYIATKSRENYYDDDLVTEILDYYNKVHSYKKVIEKYNISKGTLWYFIHKRGIDRNHEYQNNHEQHQAHRKW